MHHGLCADTRQPSPPVSFTFLNTPKQSFSSTPISEITALSLPSLDTLASSFRHLSISPPISFAQPQNTSSSAPMAAVHIMPIRGEHSAPLFDQKEPSDLGRYFKQLETLFTR